MPSFDIVAKVAWNEIDNALNQASKEIAQRFDFKGTKAELEKTSEGIVIRASTDDRVKAAHEVLKEKLVKRKVPLKHIKAGKIQTTGLSGARLLLEVIEGIDQDHARVILKWIKDEKLKVQASIQEEQLRISGKKKDDLQLAMALVRSKEFDLELSFTNFRD